MTLLAIDIGTTHLKAGLFSLDGLALHIASRPNPVHAGWSGIRSYDPHALWQNVQALLLELRDRRSAASEPVQAVGVAGMAETGLLIDRRPGASRTGSPRTPLIPWFETCAIPQTLDFRRRVDLHRVFLHTGLHISYKYSLMKLLWLRDVHPELLPGAQWLSASDYVVYRLTGVPVTDYTLAERTAAFRLDRKDWDRELLASERLPENLFPPALPSGRPAGGVLPEWSRLGLPPGTPVAIAGHDHVAGAFAAGLASGSPASSPVFDSMGTAEALVGSFPERLLTLEDEAAGFAIGLAAAAGTLYWMGGLSTSGGSVEWLRGILGDPALTYADLDALLDGRPAAPTGIVYFPYLAGSGSPHSDSQARGAFLGLNAGHTRADLYQAALEGCAYEEEYQRRIAERVIGQRLARIVAAGGGTRNRRWMQIKADVFGCPVDVLEQEEATLLGAALLAGIGAGVFDSNEEAALTLGGLSTRRYTPDPHASAAYREIFENAYQKYEAVVRSVRVE